MFKHREVGDRSRLSYQMTNCVFKILLFALASVIRMISICIIVLLKIMQMLIVLFSCWAL